MPDTLENWLRGFGKRSLPVLAHSEAGMGRLSRNPHTTLKAISRVILTDPALTIGLLRRANSQPRPGKRGEITTVEHAGLMLGNDRVFQIPGSLTRIADALPRSARAGLLRVVSRSHLAATFARDWAAARRDLAPDEVYIATLLHDIGDMALWCHDPDNAKRIERLRLKKDMAPDDAQYIVLGFTTLDIGRALAGTWRLPAFVQECMMPENALNPRHLGVQLAVQLAHDLERGWYHDALGHQYELIAEYLSVPPETAALRVRQTAIRVARGHDIYGVRPAAALLPMIPGPAPPAAPAPAPRTDAGHICLTPRRDVLKKCLAALDHARDGSRDPQYIIRAAMKGMHQGLGLNRVVFAMLSPDRRTLQARFLKGTDGEPAFNNFTLPMDRRHLFSLLIRKEQPVWVHEGNTGKYMPLMPEELYRITRIDSFYAMSIYVEGKPIGIFYADKYDKTCALDEKGFRYFTRLCVLASRALDAAKAARRKAA